MAEADLIISMLPASMHVEVARDCIALKKDVITPSYVADEMWPLDKEAREAGILILNEMGVDPGIDHMSAMKLIDGIRARGGRVKSFESYTGGLVAPESDTNPWHYKVTWNPRNVVLAGSGGTARYRHAGMLKYIPYPQLFSRVTPVDVPGYGRFEGYANRDSLKYLDVYGLHGVDTLLRGTLRKDGFCSAWQALVELGLTDDTFAIPDAAVQSWRMLTASFAPITSSSRLEQDLAQAFGWSHEVLERLTRHSLLHVGWQQSIDSAHRHVSGNAGYSGCTSDNVSRGQTELARHLPQHVARVFNGRLLFFVTFGLANYFIIAVAHYCALFLRITPSAPS